MGTLLLRKAFTGFLSFLLFLTQCLFAHSTESNLWKERSAHTTSSTGQPAWLASLPAGFALPETHLLNQVTPARPYLSSPIFQDLKRQDKTASVTRLAQLIESVPPAFGTVRGISLPHRSALERVVFHIQDVHKNEEAQQNIGKAMESLIAAQKVGLIALEGAFKAVDLSRYRAYKDKEILKKAARFSLKRGEISGPVYSSLICPSSIPPIAGIDDPAHYQANVNAYRASFPKAASLKKKLSQFETKLNRKKEKILNPDLHQFDSTVQAYKKGVLPLGAYVRALTKNPREVSLNLNTFLEALALEESVNFKNVERERSQLLVELVAKLNEREKEKLLRETVAYRLNRIRHADFYRSLQALCLRNGIKIHHYPAMNDYLQYVLLSDTIRVDDLFVEIGQLEEDIYSTLAHTAEEKQVIIQSKLADLTAKLLDFSLSAYEWGDYQRFLPTVKRGGESLQEDAVCDFHQKMGDMNSFRRFYEEAQARDRLMAENLLKELQISDFGFRNQIKNSTFIPQSAFRNPQLSILVTGGFHSRGITKHLTEAGVTIIDFVPKITKVDTESGSAYLSVFAQEKTPLAQLFEGEKLFLADRPDRGLSKEPWLPLHMGALEALNRGRIQLPVVPSESGNVTATFRAVNNKKEVRGKVHRLDGKTADLTYTFDQSQEIESLSSQILTAVIPEMITAVLLFSFSGSVLALPLASVGVRLAWFSAIFVHGFGHTCMKWIVNRLGGRSDPFKWSDVVEGTTWAEFWKGTKPFQSLYIPGISTPKFVMEERKDRPKGEVRLIALNGPAFNLLVLGLVFLAIRADYAGLIVGAPFILTVLSALLILNALFLVMSFSDFEVIYTGVPFIKGFGWGYGCGDSGISARRRPEDKGLYPQRFEHLSRRSNARKRLLGPHGEGRAVPAIDRRGRHTVVHRKMAAGRETRNPFRYNRKGPAESASFFHHKRFKPAIAQAEASGIRPGERYDEDSHARLTTEGLVTDDDTQPFLHGQSYSAANGDFNEAQIPGRPDSPFYHNKKWRALFLRMAQDPITPNEFAGDPISGNDSDMAGLYIKLGVVRGTVEPLPDSEEMLLCLMKAFRFGYVSVLFNDLNDPLPSSRKELGPWAASVLKHAKDYEGGRLPKNELIRNAKASLLQDHSSFSKINSDQFHRFVETSLTAYTENDPARATQNLAEHADPTSTFGKFFKLIDQPSRRIFLCRQQPLYIARNMDKDVWVYNSKADFAVWDLKDDPAYEEGDRIELLALKSRVDHENAGEVVDLDADKGTIKIWAVKQKRYLTDEEVRARWEDVSTAPKQLELPDEGWDTTEKELKSLPLLSQMIDEEWSNAGSSTVQAARAFAQKWASFRKTYGAHYKPRFLIVTFREEELAIANWAQKLWKKMFPEAEIIVVNANDYLEDPSPDNVQIDGNTMIQLFDIGVNNPVTWFAESLNARMQNQNRIAGPANVNGDVHDIDDLSTQEREREEAKESRPAPGFTLVAAPGELSDISRSFDEKPPALSTRYFPQTDGSIGTIWTQMLTQLHFLMLVAEHTRREAPVGFPYGLKFTQNDLKGLRQSLEYMAHQELESIVGTRLSESGQLETFESEKREKLKKLADAVEPYLTEEARATAWAVATLIVTLAILVAPFAFFGDTVASVVGPSGDWGAEIVIFIFGIFNYAFYQWLKYMWKIGLRIREGRPKWHRDANPAVVFLDAHWHGLLFVLYTKLMWAAKAIISPSGVYEGSALKTAEGKLAHIIRRGTILVLSVLPNVLSRPVQSGLKGVHVFIRQALSHVSIWRAGPNVIGIGETDDDEMKKMRFHHHATIFDSEKLTHQNTYVYNKENAELARQFIDMAFNSPARLMAQYSVVEDLTGRLARLKVGPTQWFLGFGRGGTSNSLGATTAAPLAPPLPTVWDPDRIRRIQKDLWMESRKEETDVYEKRFEPASEPKPASKFRALAESLGAGRTNMLWTTFLMMGAIVGFLYGAEEHALFYRVVFFVSLSFPFLLAAVLLARRPKGRPRKALTVPYRPELVEKETRTAPSTGLKPPLLDPDLVKSEPAKPETEIVKPSEVEKMTGKKGPPTQVQITAVDRLFSQPMDSPQVEPKLEIPADVISSASQVKGEAVVTIDEQARVMDVQETYTNDLNQTMVDSTQYQYNANGQPAQLVFNQTVNGISAKENMWARFRDNGVDRPTVAEGPRVLALYSYKADGSGGVQRLYFGEPGQVPTPEAVARFGIVADRETVFTYTDGVSNGSAAGVSNAITIWERGRKVEVHIDKPVVKQKEPEGELPPETKPAPVVPGGTVSLPPVAPAPLDPGSAPTLVVYQEPLALEDDQEEEEEWSEAGIDVPEMPRFRLDIPEKAKTATPDVTPQENRQTNPDEKKDLPTPADREMLPLPKRVDDDSPVGDTPTLPASPVDMPAGPAPPAETKGISAQAIAKAAVLAAGGAYAAVQVGMGVASYVRSRNSEKSVASNHSVRDLGLLTLLAIVFGFLYYALSLYHQSVSAGMMAWFVFFVGYVVAICTLIVIFLQILARLPIISPIFQRARNGLTSFQQATQQSTRFIWLVRSGFELVVKGVYRWGFKVADDEIQHLLSSDRSPTRVTIRFLLTPFRIVWGSLWPRIKMFFFSRLGQSIALAVLSFVVLPLIPNIGTGWIYVLSQVTISFTAAFLMVFLTYVVRNGQPPRARFWWNVSFCAGSLLVGSLLMPLVWDAFGFMGMPVPLEHADRPHRPLAEPLPQEATHMAELHRNDDVPVNQLMADLSRLENQLADLEMEIKNRSRIIGQAQARDNETLHSHVMQEEMTLADIQRHREIRLSQQAELRNETERGTELRAEIRQREENVLTAQKRLEEVIYPASFGGSKPSELALRNYFKQNASNGPEWLEWYDYTKPSIDRDVATVPSHWPAHYRASMDGAGVAHAFKGNPHHHIYSHDYIELNMKNILKIRSLSSLSNEELQVHNVTRGSNGTYRIPGARDPLYGHELVIPVEGKGLHLARPGKTFGGAWWDAYAQNAKAALEHRAQLETQVKTGMEAVARATQEWHETQQNQKTLLSRIANEVEKIRDLTGRLEEIRTEQANLQLKMEAGAAERRAQVQELERRAEEIQKEIDAKLDQVEEENSSPWFTTGWVGRGMDEDFLSLPPLQRGEEIAHTPKSVGPAIISPLFRLCAVVIFPLVLLNMIDRSLLARLLGYSDNTQKRDSSPLSVLINGDGKDNDLRFTIPKAGYTLHDTGTDRELREFTEGEELRFRWDPLKQRYAFHHSSKDHPDLVTDRLDRERGRLHIVQRPGVQVRLKGVVRRQMWIPVTPEQIATMEALKAEDPVARVDVPDEKTIFIKIRRAGFALHVSGKKEQIPVEPGDVLVFRRNSSDHDEFRCYGDPRDELPLPLRARVAPDRTLIIEAVPGQKLKIVEDNNEVSLNLPLMAHQLSLLTSQPVRSDFSARTVVQDSSREAREGHSLTVMSAYFFGAMLIGAAVYFCWRFDLFPDVGVDSLRAAAVSFHTWARQNPYTVGFWVIVGLVPLIGRWLLTPFWPVSFESFSWKSLIGRLLLWVLIEAIALAIGYALLLWTTSADRFVIWAAIAAGMFLAGWALNAIAGFRRETSSDSSVRTGATRRHFLKAGLGLGIAVGAGEAIGRFGATVQDTVAGRFERFLQSFKPYIWPRSSADTEINEPDKEEEQKEAALSFSDLDPQTEGWNEETPKEDRIGFSDDEISTPLRAPRDGELKMDPKAKFSETDWTDNGKTIPFEGEDDALLLDYAPTRATAADQEQLEKYLARLYNRFKGLYNDGILRRQAELIQRSGPLMTRVGNYNAKQENEVLGKIRGPLKKGQKGYFLKGNRSLGRSKQGDVVARVHSARRLTINMSVPMAYWQTHDFSKMRVWVHIPGRGKCEARVVRRAMRPQLNSNSAFVLTLGLESEREIFLWDQKEDRAVPVGCEIKLPVLKRREAAKKSDRSKKAGPYTSLVDEPHDDHGQATLGERKRFNVNSTGAVGRITFYEEATAQVNKTTRVAGVTSKDRELLDSIAAESKDLITALNAHLDDLKKLIGAGHARADSPEMVQFKQYENKINELMATYKLFDTEPEGYGVLDLVHQTEGQAVKAAGRIAEVQTTQIFATCSVEKRYVIEDGEKKPLLQVGEVVILRRSNGEETLGVIHRINSQPNDQGGGEDRSHMQNVVIEVNDVSLEENGTPGLWFADNETGVQVFFYPGRSHRMDQDKLKAANEKRKTWINQFRGRPSYKNVPRVHPVRFDPTPHDQQTELVHKLRHPDPLPKKSSGAKPPHQPVPDLVQKEQLGLPLGKVTESDPRYLALGDGDLRRNETDRVLRDEVMDVDRITKEALRGRPDVIQKVLDHLLEKDRIQDLIKVHKVLVKGYHKDLDVAKLARAHIFELIESGAESAEGDPLNQLIQSGSEDTELRRDIEEFFVSVLSLPEAAASPETAVVVRRILECPFWPGHADKLAVARALEASASAPHPEGRRAAALLIRCAVFAQIAVHTDRGTGAVQKQGKSYATERWDPKAWYRLFNEEENDKEDRMFLGHSPWALAAQDPVDYFEWQIGDDLYKNALENYKKEMAEADKGKPKPVSVLDMSSQGIQSDLVFTRLSYAGRIKHVKNLSNPRSLERLLLLGERTGGKYLDRRKDILQKLRKMKDPHSHFILARVLASTSDETIIRQFQSPELGKQLVDDVRRLKQAMVSSRSPGALAGEFLVYQKALAKLSVSYPREEVYDAQRLLALRGIVEPLGDFELSKLLKSKTHLLREQLEKQNVPAEAIEAVVQEQIARRAALWAIPLVRERAKLSPRSAIFSSVGSPLKDLEENALGLLIPHTEKIREKWEKGLRTHSPQFEELRDMAIYRHDQILGIEPRDVVKVFELKERRIKWVVAIVGTIAGFFWRMGRMQKMAAKALVWVFVLGSTLIGLGSRLEGATVQSAINNPVHVSIFPESVSSIQELYGPSETDRQKALVLSELLEQPAPRGIGNVSLTYQFVEAKTAQAALQEAKGVLTALRKDQDQRLGAGLLVANRDIKSKLEQAFSVEIGQGRLHILVSGKNIGHLSGLLARSYRTLKAKNETWAARWIGEEALSIFIPEGYHLPRAFLTRRQAKRVALLMTFFEGKVWFAVSINPEQGRRGGAIARPKLFNRQA